LALSTRRGSRGPLSGLESRNSRSWLGLPHYVSCSEQYPAHLLRCVVCYDDPSHPLCDEWRVSPVHNKSVAQPT